MRDDYKEECVCLEGDIWRSRNNKEIVQLLTCAHELIMYNWWKRVEDQRRLWKRKNEMKSEIDMG